MKHKTGKEFGESNMKNSFKKAAAFVLALIMVIGLVPVSAVTAEETAAKDNLAELDLLFSMNNLNGENQVAKEGTGYTFSPKYTQNKLAPVAGSSALVCTETIANGDSWVGYVGETNIPMKGAETQYVVAFEAKANIPWRLFGFAFCQPNAGDSKGQQQALLAYSENKVYVAHGLAWSHYLVADHANDYVYDGKTTIFSDMDSVSDMHEYILAFNGTNVSVYMDKTLLGEFSVATTGYKAENLALGIRMRANNKTIHNAALEANAELMHMQNIKVYGGVYQPAEKPEEPQKPAEGTEILYMDNLMGDGLRSDFGYTYTWNTAPQNCVTAIPEGASNDGAYSMEYKAGGMWYNWGGQTTIPLDTTSQYTIEFDMRKDFEKLNAGFAWSYTANNNGQGIYLYPNSVTTYYGYTTDSYRRADGTTDTSTNRPEFPNLWTACADEEGFTRFTVEIDGMMATVYVGGIKVVTYNFADNSNASAKNTWQANLALAAKGRCHDESEAKTAGTKLVSMKNISVYYGLKIQNRAPVEGEQILHMDNLAGDGLQSDFGYTYKRNGAQNVNLAADEGDVNEGIYGVADTNGGKAWYLYGGQTSIPLDENSKYTIEFYMRKDFASLNAGFVWSFTANNNAQGLYYYPNSLTTYHGYEIGCYHKQDGGTGTYSCTNLWTAYADKDGYTRFTIEIDGYMATAYVGGKAIGTYNYDDPSSTKVNAKWNSSTLSLAAKGKRFPEVPEFEENGRLVSVKDINVYYGNVAQNSHVSFLYGDTTLTTQSYAPGSVIETFPTVPDITLESGQTLFWFYKHTNVLVQTPYTVLGDATLEARICDKNSIRVAAAQYTEANADTKTQSVRFIATLFSLDAESAGFRIEAKYMENGVLKTKTWIRESTTVYSEIKARQTSGTVESVTAEELSGLYLLALSVDDVPTDAGQIDFYVTGFVVVNGETVESEVKTFTMVEGVYDADAGLMS